MTKGGPAGATDMIANMLYSVGFTLFDIGQGSALAVILFVFLIALAGIAVATMAAYAFARDRFPGGNLAFAAVVATLMIPSHITRIPNYLTLAKAGLLDSYAGLILPAISSGFAAVFLRQSIRDIPRAG
ncbi:L-arabinose transport system permease protein AraQ [Pseudooceanicola marinus]|uniref:sn-glycerol-3-phosphate transport system permease protein UgpE n=1 Tax=Pseudooceanicola marinus TaxID=396013 RepID=A0A1X6Z4D9_9RHOB|nr:hypothetical protein [Pseudooceanicola marinus]SLN39948.1 L-arabinose transport system permease protein AraQ [Pseudooceanicola marinus]